VRWFRRDRETLNEQLLREAGLAERREGIRPLRPRDEAGDWDVVVSVWAAGFSGDQFEFVAETDGSLIVDESVHASLAVFADAIEHELAPPYRARVVRQARNQWSAAARTIRVIRLLVRDAETIELTRVGGVATYLLDGREADAATAPRELIGIGHNRAANFAVRAARLDGDLWEVIAEELPPD
jgi:hypothetical protein